MGQFNVMNTCKILFILRDFLDDVCSLEKQRWFCKHKMVMVSRAFEGKL